MSRRRTLSSQTRWMRRRQSMFGDVRRIFEQETQKPKNVWQTLRRFAGYFKRYWPQYLGVLALMVAATWAQVTTPDLIGQAVDCYFTPAVASAVSQVPAGFASSGPAASNCWYATLPANWTSADLISGVGGLLLRVAALFVLASAAPGMMFYLMTWSGQHVRKTLRV